MIVLFGRRIRVQEAQAEQLLIELEESRGAELRAAALAERQRLARDMHDVLAHSLSGLLLQLEGARLLALASPADQRLAGTIDRAHELAKNGLDEARQAIGMLRDDDLPGPDRLAALTAAFQADTGVPARFSLLGNPQGAGLGGPARPIPGDPGGADQRAQARPPRTRRGPVGLPPGRVHLEVEDSLHRVTGGQAALDPAVQLHLVEAIAERVPAGPDPAPLPDGLTPREAEVLTLIAAGLSNAEIAERLVVSEATVKSHVNHMLAKIGARDRAQAVGYAYRHGLVHR